MLNTARNIRYALLATAMCAAGVLFFCLILIMAWPIQLVLRWIEPDGEGIEF